MSLCEFWDSLCKLNICEVKLFSLLHIFSLTQMTHVARILSEYMLYSDFVLLLPYPIAGARPSWTPCMYLVHTLTATKTYLEKNVHFITCEMVYWGSAQVSHEKYKYQEENNEQNEDLAHHPHAWWYVIEMLEELPMGTLYINQRAVHVLIDPVMGNAKIIIT